MLIHKQERRKSKKLEALQLQTVGILCVVRTMCVLITMLLSFGKKKERTSVQLKKTIILLTALTALVALAILVSFQVDGGHFAMQLLGPIAGCVTHTPPPQ
jgi:uncharacterized protein with PQ loop repeat